MNFEDLIDGCYEIINDNKVEYLLSLLHTSGLSNEVKEDLVRELETFDVTPERYEVISKIILNSQMDLINSGLNYNQTDISRKIKKEI